MEKYNDLAFSYNPTQSYQLKKIDYLQKNEEEGTLSCHEVVISFQMSC